MTHSTPSRWIDSILMRPLRHVLERPTRVLKRFVEPGMTVLDVGCGSGLYSIAMARLVGPDGRVIAVDIDPDAITKLRERLAGSRLSRRIEPRLCSGHDLGLDDLKSRFDLALAVYVLHHASDPSQLMANVRCALKPGGIFLVIEPGHHSSPPEREALESAARQAPLMAVSFPKLLRDWAVVFQKAKLSA